MSTVQTWVVTVGPAFGNRPPVVTSTPLTEVRVSGSYAYQVRARDEDFDPIGYAVSSPTLTGLQIDSDGLLTWTAPASATSGEVTVTATDGRGGAGEQTFTLDVIDVNPATVSGVVFDDTDGDGLRQGGEPGLEGWRVFVDRDGDGLRSAGEWAALTDADGAYTVADVLPGDYTLRAERQFGRGFSAPAGGQQAILLSAGQALTGRDFAVIDQANRAPVLSGTPGTSAVVGQLYTFAAAATDDDGDPLAFDLPVRPGGMFVHPATGALSWTPAADQLGEHPVLLRVKDGHGGVDLLWFTVTVDPANHRPFIVSLPPPGLVEPGMTYHYPIAALDPDAGDTLTFAKLNPTPAGVSVNSATGELTWNPQATGATPGTYTLSVEVRDADDLTDVQTWQVEVGGAYSDRSPVVVTHPRTVTTVGEPYRYPVRAIDPDGNPLTVSLVNPPSGMTLSSDDVVEWTPAVPGEYAVSVKASDGNFHQGATSDPDAEYKHTQTFTLTVLPGPAPNRAPVVVTAPPAAADIDSLYAYDVLAADPDDDFVRYALLGPAPDGVVLDGATGALRWRPAAWQAGHQTISVRAVDRFGASADHTFTVLVRAGNRPPLITSSPDPRAEVGEFYAYAVRAEDPDGDAVSLSWSGDTPPGLSLLDGLISGTPTTSGTYSFTVRATDARGAIAEQPVTLEVIAQRNRPPVVGSDPVLDTVTGATYEYQVTASDPDGDGLSYSVTTSPSVSMSVDANGLVIWSVPANYVAPGATAEVQVTVRATDDGTPVKSAEQSYTLTVRGNQSPSLADVGDRQVTAGNPFRLDLQGSDPDPDDTLTYTLTGRNGTEVPAGLTVDDLGRVRWAGTAEGTYDFTATVTDPYGLSDSRDFTLTVSADTTDPSVELEVAEDPGKINADSRFRVRASDNVGVVERKLEVSADAGQTWEVIGLDGDGVGRWTFATAQVYKLRATATDAAGSTATAERDLTVIDPSAANPPDVAITAPASDAKVTTLADVTGTITDPDGLLSWRLEYQPADGSSPWKVIREVTSGLGTSVSVSEPFDPTLLRNGPYVLRLTATDAGGNTGAAVRTVQVDGRLKLGNLTFSATDLTIPVAGIPVTVGRVYDTLDAGREGDFGFGWRLDLGGYSLAVDAGTTAPAFLNRYPTFRDGTRVYVTRPDGGVDGYTFAPVPASVLFGTVLSWYPAFTPDAGVLNALVVDPVPLTKIASTGEYIDYELGGYNPANPSFGGAYDVVEYGGLTHEVDGQSGDQVSVRDRNENKLTFEADAIVSNRGVQVTFERDARGRVVAAEDPRGNKVRYRYDANGDLVEVTDRAGVVIASYAYRTDEPLHYLTAVTDAEGTRSLAASYRSDDRLERLEDAEGNPATFAYTLTPVGDPDPERATQTVTLPGAGTGGADVVSTLGFDARGNVTRAVDPLGEQMLSSFEDPNHPDAPTKLVQVVGAPGGGDDLETVVTYDPATGLPETVTDPTGARTITHYNDLGLPTSVSDPLGNTTVQRYDDKGNQTYIRSPEGVASSFTYDIKGNVVTVTRGGATTQMAYDPVGRVSQSTDPEDNVTRFFYDANGNRTSGERDWYADPVAKTGKVTFTSTVIYDENDRAVSRIDEQGLTAGTAYDEKGRPVRTTDVFGNASETVFDARGLVVESRSPDGTVWRIVYDAQGRAVYATDPFLPGRAEPVRGTHTVYDGAGRVVRTERLKDLTIEIVTGAGGRPAAKLVSAGVMESASETGYDALGRVEYSIQFAGSPHAAKTAFEYDAAGRRTAVITYLDSGFTTFSRTEVEYDKAGRAVLGTDPLGKRTHTEYDGDGRVTKVTFAGGAWTATGYDRLGRKTSATVLIDRATGAAQTTDYEYDDLGRLTAVVQPEVTDAKDGQAYRPRYAYGYDANGNLVSVADPYGRTTLFTHDAFGRQTGRTLPAVGSASDSESMAYDSYGNLDYRLDFAGWKQDFVYDYDLPGGPDFGWLVEVRLFDATGTQVETVGYTYDAYGRRNVVTETKGSEVRVTDTGYDDQGRVARVVSPEGVIEYSYDDVTGRQVKMWTQFTEVGYGYDVLGRLETVTESKRGGTVLADPVVTRYTFDAVGNVSKATVTEGVNTLRVTENTYDPDRHWLVGVANEDGSGNPLSTFDCSRRADGQILQVAESVKQPDGTFVTTTAGYTYDALNRLIGEDVDTSAAGGDYTISYGLALVGNRISKVHTSEGGTVTETKEFYDERDRLTHEEVWQGGAKQGTINYGYDANGSLTSRTGYQGDSAAYEWDVRGRLVGATIDDGQGTVTEATYRYTPQGIRSSVTEVVNAGQPTTTLHVIDVLSPSGYAQVVEERTESGPVVASYVYGNGLEPVSQWQGQGAGLYLADGHSGVRQVIDPGTAAVLAAYRYDAFGNTVAQAGTLANPVGYRGERFDATLGQYYLRARFFDPSSGRFTAMDPYAGRQESPLTLHKYAYGHSNPVGNLDPSGLISILGVSFSTRAFVVSMVSATVLSTIVSQFEEIIANYVWGWVPPHVKGYLQNIGANQVPDGIVAGVSLGFTGGYSFFGAGVEGGAEGVYSPRTGNFGGVPSTLPSRARACDGL